MKHRPTLTAELLKNAAPVTFCLIILLGFFGVFVSLLTYQYPPENKDFIASLSETLKNILIMAVSYWFGSNSSSKAKDEALSEIAKQPIAPVAPVAPVLPLAPVAPINIPDAANVTVKTQTGDVSIESKEKTAIIPPIKGVLT